MARLTDKLQETTSTITSNPQTAGLAGEIRPFAGDTSGWPVVNGVRQLKGWAVCEGDILEQADYPDLFANIQATWNSFAHPVDGTPTVGGSQFALPNLKGLFLGGAGNNGDSTLTLGSYAGDTAESHTHSDGSLKAHVHATENALALGRISASFTSDVVSSNVSFAADSTSRSLGVDVSGNTGSNEATSGETRPKTAPVSYIIALYNNVANVITTNDLTVSNVTVTGGLITDTANATTVSADNVSATTYTGLPEATTSTSGVVKKNKWQRKNLENDLTAGQLNSNLLVSDLTFENLEIDKFYRLTVQGVFKVTTAEVSIFDLYALHSSNRILALKFYSFPEFGIHYETGSVIFKAETSQLNFFYRETPTTTNTSKGNLEGGFDSFLNQYFTYAILEELNNYEETSDFTPTP